MAVEYLFVGSVFTFVIALSFNILGIESDFPRNIYYILFGGIATFLCGYMVLASDVAMMIPLMWFLFALGIIDFILVVLLSFSSLNVYRKTKRGWPD